MMHAYFINERGLEKLVRGAGPPVGGQLDEVVSTLELRTWPSGLRTLRQRITGTRTPRKASGRSRTSTAYGAPRRAAISPRLNSQAL